jgi:cell division protein FtsB
MVPDSVNPLRWKKPILVAVLVGAAVIWFLFFDTYSLLTRIQLENRKDALIEQTEEYRNEAEELDKQIQELENNPQLIEKIAREDYGMRKPDETVYKVEPAE